MLNGREESATRTVLVEALAGDGRCTPSAPNLPLGRHGRRVRYAVLEVPADVTDATVARAFERIAPIRHLGPAHPRTPEAWTYRYDELQPGRVCTETPITKDTLMTTPGSPFFFGLHRGHLSESAHEIAHKHGAEHVNYTEPRGQKVGWFECPNRGEPFNSATAQEVMAAISAAGGIEALEVRT